MPKPDYAIPLYRLPLEQLYTLVRIERDRLGLTKEELKAIALEFYGGEIPEPLKPADYINFTYYLRRR
jgi:hypothetical protein